MSGRCSATCVTRVGSFTAGKKNPTGEIVRGTWPEVIPWELWERCAAIHRANRSDRIIAVDRRACAFTLSGLWLRAIPVEPFVAGDIRLRGTAAPAKTVTQRHREIEAKIEPSAMARP